MDSELSSTRVLNPVSVDFLLTFPGGGINLSVSPKGNLFFFFLDLKDVFGLSAELEQSVSQCCYSLCSLSVWCRGFMNH